MAGKTPFDHSKYSALSTKEHKVAFKNLLNIFKIEPLVSEKSSKVTECLQLLLKHYQPSQSDLAEYMNMCEEKLKHEVPNLVSDQNALWAKVWQFFVTTLGRELHAATSTLNTLLTVLEKAMKYKDETLVLAFNCWSTLIDNFSLRDDVLPAKKRIKLLMIPLKSRLAKDYKPLIAKFNTWWHLIVKLQANIDKHYTVLKSFVEFSYGPFDKDSLMDLQNLNERVPDLSSSLKQALVYMLGFGIPSVEEKIQASNRTLEAPTVPIFPRSKYFVDFYKDLTYAVCHLLEVSHGDAFSQLAFEALVKRIEMMHEDRETSWRDGVCVLLLQTKKCILNLASDHQETPSIFVVDTILSAWPSSILNITLENISGTPRAFLLDLLLDEKQLLANSKLSIEKQENRYVQLVHSLMERQEMLVAGPEVIADVAKLTEALAKMYQAWTTRALETDFSKLLYMWDQLSRVIIKYVPKECANEDCIIILKKNLLDLLLEPLEWILHYKSAASYEKLSATWKHLFTKYCEVSALSLMLNKQSSSSELSKHLLLILSRDVSYSITAIIFFIHVTSQLFTTKVSSASKQVEDQPEDFTEIELVLREATLLKANTRSVDARTAKALMILIKTSQTLMITHADLKSMLKMLNLYIVLISKSLDKIRVHDEQIAEAWNVFAHQFTEAANKFIFTDSKELKHDLRVQLQKVQDLKSHDNVKVQQGANDLEKTLLDCIGKTGTRLLALANIKMEEKQESPSPVPNAFSLPSVKFVGRKRPRKQSLVHPSPAARPAMSSSPTRSPVASKPALEEQDSQDFVKIPAKPAPAKKILTPHQRESKRRRRDDIPALYQGLSQDTINTQDTQDTQDTINLLSSGPPVTTATQSLVICEDANDLDITELKKVVPEESAIKGVEENISSRSIEMPRTPERKKTTVEEAETAAPTSFFNILSPGGVAKKEVVKNLPTSTTDDDEVMIIEETPVSTRSSVVIAATREKDSAQNIPPVAASPEKVVDDSQDIIENSQTTVPLKEISILKAADAENIGKSSSPSDDKRRLPTQNRQGVMLPSRANKITTDNIAKEKALPWLIKSSLGRAAQMLEMASANVTISSKENSPVMSTPLEVASKSSMSTEQPTVSDPQCAAETSPAKSSMGDELSTVSTPLSSVSKAERRSNLKRAAKQDDTPSPKRSKRVSFAEPVVSSAQESPKILSEESTFKNLYKGGSPRRGKSFRASRKLLLIPIANRAGAAGNLRSVSSEAVTSQGSLQLEEATSSDGPIFPELMECQESIEVIAAKLSSPLLEKSTIDHLLEKEITTIGELSSMPELLIKDLNIKEPKIQTVKHVLLEYVSAMEEPIVEDDVPDQLVELESEPEPLVEEPQDAVNDEGLQEQLNKLLGQYSMKEVLQSLGDSSEVFKQALSLDIPKNVVTDTLPALVKMCGTEQVLNHVLTCAKPQEVIEKVASKMPMSDIREMLHLKNDVIDIDCESDSKEIIKKAVKNSETKTVLEALGNSKEVFDYVLTYSEPLALIKSAAARQNVADVLNAVASPHDQLKHVFSFTNPIKFAKKLLPKLPVYEVLQLLGRKEEVLDHVLHSNQPHSIVSKITSELTVQEMLALLSQHQDKLNQYFMEKLSLTDLTKRMKEKHDIDEVLKSVGSHADILEFVVANVTLSQVLTKAIENQPTAAILEAVGREHEVLTQVVSKADTSALLAEVIPRVPVAEVMNMLDNKEVLENVMTTFEPSAVFTKACQVIDTDALQIAVQQLDNNIKHKVCESLPVECLQEKLMSVLTCNEREKTQLIKTLTQHLSNTDVTNEFTRRCSNNQLNSEILPKQMKKIGSIIPANVLLELLKNVLKSEEESKDLKTLILNCASTNELVSTLVKKCELEKMTLDQLESDQSLEVSKLLPLKCLVERVESILGYGSVGDADALKTAMLPHFSSLQLLEHLCSEELNEASEDAVLARNKLVMKLMKTTHLYNILKTGEDRLATEKVDPAIIKCIKALTTHLPNQVLLNIIHDKKFSKNEKFQLMESQINVTPITDVMSLLPIKDVIRYYQSLITKPETSAQLLRTSINQIPDCDLVRFLGSERLLNIIKAGTKGESQSISDEQLLANVSLRSLVAEVCNMASCPNKCDTMIAQLKTSFPREQLAQLISAVILDKGSPSFTQAST